MKVTLLSAIAMLMAVFTAAAQEPQKLPATATTSLDVYENYAVSNVTDGSLSSFFWGIAPAEGDYILLTLDAVYNIGEIKVYFREKDRPETAKVQISSDNVQWTDISTVNSYTIGDSDMDWMHLSDGDNREARYVRLLLSPSAAWLQVAEIEVYGYISEKTDAPRFSLDDGISVIQGSIEELSIYSEEGATIYYTTDGTWPDENTSQSIVSGGVLRLETTASWHSVEVIKAISKLPGKDASVLSVFTYTIAAPYCNSSFPSVGNEGVDYVGKMLTLTVTGAEAEATWTNPVADDAQVNGYEGTIENAFTVRPGGTVTLDITSKDTKWGAIRVYADKNGNYMFDSDENILRAGDPNGGGEGLAATSCSFTVEPTTLGGTYLVRVLYVPNDIENGHADEYNSADACGTYQEGGYYDFAFSVLTDDKTITADEAEPGDAAYAVVSVLPEDAASRPPVWDLDGHSVASEELVIDVAATGEAPEIYITGAGKISARTIKVNRRITSDEWTLMALPFDADLSSVTVNGQMARYGSNIRIMEYDAAKRAQGSVDGYTVSGWTEKTGGTIPANEGFALVVNPSNGAEQVVTFSAAGFHMEADDKVVTFEANPSQANMVGGKSGDADWNFNGNPMLQSHPKEAGYTLYVFDAKTNTYDELSSADTHTYTPYSAYFLQCDAESGFMELTFTHGAGPYLLAAGQATKGCFQLEINGGEDCVRITEKEGSSPAYLRNEDAIYFAPLSGKISQLWLVDGEGVEIASSVVPEPYREITLAYKAAKAGTQTLAVTSLIPGTAVILVDNETGAAVPMYQGSEYTFTSPAGTDNRRFTLLTDMVDFSGIENGTAETAGIRAVVSGGNIRIYGVPAGETIEVYTVNGVSVSSVTSTGPEEEIPVPACGVLLVKSCGRTLKVIK